MVKDDPFAKRAQEGDDTVLVVEDDAMPVVNQDKALVDPFGDSDDWAIGIMSKAFLKIRHVLQNTGPGTSTGLERKR
jgi:hypothetical protein